MTDHAYRARWQAAEAQLREFARHHSVPPETQRRRWRDLRRQYGIASRTIAELRGENARLREELAKTRLIAFKADGEILSRLLGQWGHDV